MELKHKVEFFLLFGMLLLENQGLGQTIRLRDMVEVTHDEITLRDLLPTQAPMRIQQETSKLILGRSPNFGSTRVIDANQIKRALPSAELQRQLIVPDRALVRRIGFPVQRGQIALAVQSYVEETGAKLVWDATGLMWDQEINAFESTPPLRVLGQLNHLAGDPSVIYFLLGCRKSRSCGDFAVRLQLKQPLVRPSNIGNSLAHPDLEPTGQPITMAPGTRAWLILEGDGISLRVRVTCLQRGILGQRVRVLDAVSHRVHQARITGREELHERLDS